MNTKLTLKLNQQIIEEAKKYAASKKISLSGIIESYLQSLISNEEKSDFEISPFVRSISTGKSVPLDVDMKEAYSNFVDVDNTKWKRF